jgi:uncharacterized protein with NAD-binding domain and iron-sulfur cluster
MPITKIAILGGGFGALAAAFGLTNQPGWQNRYEVTVYQQGWRLGGKGASTRGPNNRIEEHGLHAFGGYYENAFTIVQTCAAEVGVDWRTLFKRQSNITWPSQLGGTWSFEPMQLEEREQELPGTGVQPPTPAGFVCKMIPWAAAFMRNNMDDVEELKVEPSGPPPDLSGLVGLAGLVNQLIAIVPGIVNVTPLTPDDLTKLEPRRQLLRLIDEVVQILGMDGGGEQQCEETLKNPVVQAAVKALLQVFQAVLRWVIAPTSVHTPKGERFFVFADMTAAQVIGMIDDGIIEYGFDGPDGRVDQIDLRDWFRNHGASEVSLQSRMMHSLYDYGFAYVDGDPNQPRLAAGTALRVLCRFLMAYRGAVQWKFTRGMGEAIFLPIYQALANRGVRFEFFHRVKALRLSTDKHSISAIDMVRQLRVKSPPYRPLDGAASGRFWPPEPLYKQIADQQVGPAKAVIQAGGDLEVAEISGVSEPRTLRVGQDFDLVVLAIPIGALGQICAELRQANSHWQQMLADVRTVPTQSFQTWILKEMPELGWTPPPSSKRPPTFTVAYQDPFNTWGDLSDLIKVEGWPSGAERPGSLVYFCGPMKDDGSGPAAAHASVVEAARKWLDLNAGRLWPGGTPSGNPSALDFNLLARPGGGSAETRFQSQFFRANVSPSDRYVLSVPGSLVSRMRADESGFDNLYLAGDWVRTGLNFGCIEAAGMAGLAASRAISGQPAVIYGERDL